MQRDGVKGVTRKGGRGGILAAAAVASLATAIVVSAGGVASADVPAPQPVGEPLELTALHAPMAVAAAAPVQAPPGVLRFGSLIVAVPPFVPAEPVGQLNAASAANESQLSTYLRSIGVGPDRSDRMAAAIVGNAVGGAAIACVAGGSVLWVLLGVLATPLLPFDCAKDIVLGGGVGALVGAAEGAFGR